MCPAPGAVQRPVNLPAKFFPVMDTAAAALLAAIRWLSSMLSGFSGKPSQADWPSSLTR